ncbi:hypothetical protein DNL40_09845 [Xylanimonas oleitrophica]|uniref:Altered inheritance of mitochondria protein 6 n=1 Tax=Xylanimonas oleitrophica TaxID=2607479 RepID=A0A2W5WYN7_9MICO|nr:phosphatidylinositol-specific phospholipase C/glycerophosphodiester phosphodiesterase family protein [Xylanimonas oleitrophica]PZR52945.1 hypothetical protein DNL40_09845 [Xylanimonas oleitrophica]
MRTTGTTRLVRGVVAAALAATAALVPATAATASSADVVLGTPHARAHAHNDYEHQRPLLDALQHGFTSVEADVWLIDGELRVAHESRQTRPGRTLESLYLAPLRDVVRAGGGRVYPGWDGTFQLLVDIKSDGERTYAAVERALAAYPEVFVRYADGQVHGGPVQAVISGNRPLATMTAARERYGFYDGRSGDVRSGRPTTLMPLVSESWTTMFSWRGSGSMPAAQRTRLRDYVAQAHASGYRVRFWNTPDSAGAAREAVWRELLAAGVDHINTDDLAGLDRFLAANGG